MIYTGDCLKILPTLDAESVQCCVTSPPYWGLRDYGVEGQLGLEKTPEEYVAKMVDVFREVRRVLRDDGTLWLNLGDSYAGSGKCSGRTWEDGKIPKMSGKQHSNTGSLSVGRSDIPNGIKPKDLCGIPWRVAFALQADGWWLRQDIIWHKPNPMPESVTDRCTKAHEYIFLLTKSARYYYDADSVKEKSIDRESFEGRNWRDLRQCDKTGDPKLKQNFYKLEGKTYPLRNRRSVWTITTKPFSGAHFAVFPPEIPEICIKAGTSEKGCCPECGSPCERTGEKETLWRERPNQYTSYREINGQPDQRKSGTVYTTTGWRPTCTHDAAPVPCTVLDPFSGSGTTGNVAERLGRKYIGIELNPAYSEMGEKRIDAARLPLAEQWG